MAGIPDNVIDQIQDRIDIVEVIGSYLPLKKAGRNYRGLCPFHHEKTPSFMVSQDKQIFHCFGCGEGGNVFNFLMKYERLEFPEAVRMLAQKAGVVIPERLSAESKAQSSLSSKLYAANEMASAYFQNVLRQDSLGKKAYAYLLGRGLNDETIKMFRLGFASSSWDDLINYAKQKGTSADILEKSGLAIAKENGGYYDRFKERIMFTIFDPKSRILGFGGRVFLPPEADQPSADKANNSPKYMNSPETSIYNKGRNLYGLNFTWKFIRDEDEAVIVEGYLDLIVPFQHGIKNMVSSLGTSLTEDQIRLIGRYTKNTVIIFDPDKAGELATLRSLDLLLQEDLSVKVVRLPEGFDPDSFISRYGAQEFKNRIKTGQSLFDYKMSVLLSKYDKSRLEDKAKITGEMLPTIARVQNAVLQSGYIKMLADAISTDEDAIRQELKKVKPEYPAPRLQEAAKEPLADACRDMRLSEKILAGILLDDNAYAKCVADKLGLDEIRDPVARKIVEIIFRHGDPLKPVTAGKIIRYIEDSQAHKFIPEIADCVEAVMDKEKTLNDCIIKIKQDNLKEKLARLQVEIALAQTKADEEKITRLIAECDQLLRSIKVNNEEKTQEAKN